MPAESSAAAPARTLPAEWGAGIEKLHPSYFAMSMATGVAAMSSHFFGMTAIATFLFWLNVGAYAVLWGLTLARLACYPRSFLADWSDHNRSVGFFTTVAATSILGTQFAVMRADLGVGRALWFAALGLWFLSMYVIFTALTIKEHKPSLAEGINGGWLTAVVASMSLCVLGCAVSETFAPHREEALLVMTCLWLAGGMLYIWLISLIFYRYTFFAFLPSDLSPPYWINMGALAIAALAGASLIANAPTSPLLTSLRPFLEGFMLWYWATATWWIPMLVTLAIWRHVLKRFPLRYDPLYWGAVFPIAMYSTSTYRMAGVLGMPFVAVISHGFALLALAAWALAFWGLVRRLAALARLTVLAGAGRPAI